MSALVGAKPADWTRERWLEWRRDGIGGSDVAALCGLSRFASPMSVFVDKCQLGAPRETTKAMLWGQIHEPNIARAFEEETGLFVLHAQALAVDDDHPWRRSTLDGLVAESPDLELAHLDEFLGICEIKCTRDWTWDDLPDEYAVQLQWQLGVTGLERGWVPVLHQGNNDRIYGPFDADPRVYAALCSIVDRFWSEHVVPVSQPPADGSAATTEALKAAFPSSDGEPVELAPEVLESVLALPAAKQRVKDAEAEVDRIENELRAALGDHAAGGVRDADGEIVPVATWKTQSSERLDGKALRAAHPALAEEFTRTMTSRVLRQTKHLTELLEGANA